MKFLFHLLMPVLGSIVSSFTVIESAYGQIAVIAPTLAARTGDLLTIPIRFVSNDSINGLQFTLKWNASVLKYDNLTSLGFVGQSLDGNFGRTDTANGMIRFLWAHSQARNIKVLDTLTLFQLRLRVIGAGGTSSLIAIVDTPTRAIGTSGGNATPILVQKQNGLVNVLRTGIENLEIISKKLTLHPIAPNPVTDFLHISFFLNQSETITYFLTNLTGQIVYTFRELYANGAHQIQIPTASFPTGLYRLVLNENGHLHQRPLLITH